jgi:hypothetical protein
VDVMGCSGPGAGVAMDIAAESAGCGDGLQVARKSVQVGLIEALGEGRLVGFGDGTQRGKESFPLGGEVHLVAAAVGRAAAPLDAPMAFKAVEDGDDPARSDAQLLARRLLADARVATDQPQQPRPDAVMPSGARARSNAAEASEPNWASRKAMRRGRRESMRIILAHLLNHSSGVLSVQ